MRKILLAFVIVISAASFAFGDKFYLRDGRTIEGTLLGFVNGRFVVRVERRYSTSPSSTTDSVRRRDDSDIQYFRPEEIDRIEIEGRSLDSARFQTRNVQVTLDSSWIDSGVYVRSGQRVQVNATGVIVVGRDRITPDGLRSTDPTAPLPNAAEGKLIGAIGDDSQSPIIELGSSREFTADRSGRLYLTANRGSYYDARGSFDVQVRRERNLDTTTDYREDTVGRGRRRDRDRTEPTRTRVPQEIVISVPGTSRSLDTGLDIHAGDSITLTATGTIVGGRRIGEIGPDGAPSTGFGINARPVPTAGVGALIAYIRNPNGQLSTPYLIGSSLTTTVPMDGRLILAINDDDYSDNGGSFSVRIRY